MNPKATTLYLITKLQNLKAIHNRNSNDAQRAFVVSNYKITKSESYSQHADCTALSRSLLYLITKLQNLKAIHNVKFRPLFFIMLYLITKLQNLKAIHNCTFRTVSMHLVVSNYKITKSESYSQHPKYQKPNSNCCI